MFSGLKFRPLFFDYSKNSGVVPIILIATASVGWMCFSIVKAFTRTEIVITRNTKKQGELYDLIIHPQHRKFFYVNEIYFPNQELYDVYMEMEKAKAEQNKKEC